MDFLHPAARAHTVTKSYWGKKDLFCSCVCLCVLAFAVARRGPFLGSLEAGVKGGFELPDMAVGIWISILWNPSLSNLVSVVLVVMFLESRRDLIQCGYIGKGQRCSGPSRVLK